ncbi:MAG: hypothetical protein H6Q86_5887 [candidate division NC10 bacterium]|nr:hypothetical protein [candidate division NC10 bacterium]
MKRGQVHAGAVGNVRPSRPPSAVERIPTRRETAVVAPPTPDATVGLERIKQFSRRLARTPVSRRQRRALTEAIRIEADAYRKSLDTEQVMAKHDRH